MREPDASYYEKQFAPGQDAASHNCHAPEEKRDELTL